VQSREYETKASVKEWHKRITNIVRSTATTVFTSWKHIPWCFTVIYIFTNQYKQFVWL